MFSSDTICYFNAGSSDTAELLGNYLSKILIKNGFSDIAPVLLCIGSDRVTGDSLGPMVGSALEERYKKSIPVFGTLKMPVHALNLEETIDAIHLHFPDHPLILPLEQKNILAALRPAKEVSVPVPASTKI